MDNLATIFAISGAFLTALKTNRSRFIGFIGYIIANILWVVWATTGDVIIWSIVIQNSVFIIPATLGAWNNRHFNKNTNEEVTVASEAQACTLECELRGRS